ncbi:MAG: cytochrome c3 family protein [Nitrospinota bacterium]
MMRTRWKVGLLAFGIVAALARAPSAWAAEAVTGTKHDFSDLSKAGHICFTCHYPHKAGQSQLIWNHQYSANSFSWTDATQTTGLTTLPTNIGTPWSGPTKLCLSCHDGSVAIGDVMAPGMTDWSTTDFVTGNRQVATATGDLSGNHPVEAPYPYNGVQNTYNGITTGADVNIPGFVATPAVVKIFADSAAVGPNNRGIECPSCHNPHDDSNGKFLRVDKGAICQNCHAK